jgi:hypothetical protein
METSMTEEAKLFVFEMAIRQFFRQGSLSRNIFRLSHSYFGVGPHGTVRTEVLGKALDEGDFVYDVVNEEPLILRRDHGQKTSAMADFVPDKGAVQVDVVAIVLGYWFPLILWPLANDYYSLIGNAYIGCLEEADYFKEGKMQELIPCRIR